MKEIITEIYQQAKNREINPSGDFDNKKDGILAML